MNEALERYLAKFGEMPPMAAWGGDQDQLIAAIDKAISAGKPIDEEKFLEDQNAQMPADAVY